MKLLFPILLLITISFSYSSLLFRIKDTEPNCLGGEFNENSILVVKYKLFTISRQEISPVFPYLLLYFHKVKTRTKINAQHIYTNKGKLILEIKEAGLYEICIQSQRFSVISNLKEDLYVSFKMASANDEDDITSKAINYEDVSSVNQKVKQILRLTNPIIDNQENQLHFENEFSLKILANASLYKYLTFIQLIITFIIGIVQICNFRRFLKSQHVI